VSRSRFVSNTTALGVAAVLTTILTLAQVKILAGFLSKGAFGLFASLRGLSLLFSMVAANGLPQLLTRFLPSLQVEGRKASMLQISLVSIAVASGLLVLCVAFVHLFRASVFADVDPNVGGGAFMFWFYATTVGVALKLVIYGGFGGLRRMDAQVILETVSMAIQIVWLFIIRDELSVSAAFRVFGVVSVATVIVGLPWFLVLSTRDATGVVEPRPAIPSERAVYLKYWVGATGLSIVAMAFTDVDRYILSQVIAFEVLGLFHVASRIAHIAKRFLGLPALAFQPEVTRLDAEGRDADVRLSTRVFVKFNIVVSVLTAGLVIVYAPEIIRVVASSEYLDAFWLVVLFALSVPLSAMTAPLTTLMKARDEVVAAFWCDLVWALSYVIALVALTSSIGIIGAGVAMFVACVAQLVTAVGLSRLPRSERVSASALLQTVVAVALALAPIAVVSQYWALSPGANFAVKVGLALPALLLFRWLMSLRSVFSTDERSRLVAVLSQRGLKPLAVVFK